MAIPLELLCEECNKKEGNRQFCNGDGRLHGHGSVHTFDGWLKYLCNDCHEEDKQKWTEAKKGWVGYGKFHQPDL